MKGEIIKKEDNRYMIKWSDLHSFGHGWHYVETDVLDNDIKGHKVGDVVEIEFKDLPLNLAIIK